MAGSSSLEAVRRKIRSLQEQADAAEDASVPEKKPVTEGTQAPETETSAPEAKDNPAPQAETSAGPAPAEDEQAAAADPERLLAFDQMMKNLGGNNR